METRRMTITMQCDASRMAKGAEIQEYICSGKGRYPIDSKFYGLQNITIIELREIKT